MAILPFDFLVREFVFTDLSGGTGIEVSPNQKSFITLTAIGSTIDQAICKPWRGSIILHCIELILIDRFAPAGGCVHYEITSSRVCEGFHASNSSGTFCLTGLLVRLSFEQFRIVC